MWWSDIAIKCGGVVIGDGKEIELGEREKKPTIEASEPYVLACSGNRSCAGGMQRSFCGGVIFWRLGVFAGYLVGWRGGGGVGKER